MEIQQKEKESLAAYIHHFKMEAKRCNFTNSAATIRIFVKGLKNAHTIAAQVYEKGHQTVADAISKVEKLHGSAATNSYLVTFICSKCNVPLGRPMFPMYRVRSHSMSLSKCMLL